MTHGSVIHIAAGSVSLAAAITVNFLEFYEAHLMRDENVERNYRKVLTDVVKEIFEVVKSEPEVNVSNFVQDILDLILDEKTCSFEKGILKIYDKASSFYNIPGRNFGENFLEIIECIRDIHDIRF